MKNLYEAAAAREIRERIERLVPDSPRQWGVMDVAQMMAHCSAWLEMAAGSTAPPRSLLGRLFGRVAKRSVLGDGPIRRSMPTDKSLIRNDVRQFAEEQRRLIDWVDRFSAGGPEHCTTHPHSFFGPMSPLEWATMGYKHLDHHLRQFSV